jgi:ubiquinone/menaquinone biosynthesis C-methylase UbiE
MASRTTAESARVVPYRLSASVYDRVYAWKNYPAEARRIHQLVRRFGRSPGRRLLDVACGTGEHLRSLARWYHVMSLDRSGDMLREAWRKLPGVRFVRGSMQEFRFAERFDVITCLFSAIGHVRSRADLRRALANFARHLEPGGVLIVEPWLTPSEYRPGSVHLGTYGTRERPIARMNTSGRQGSRSVMDMHYLVAERGRVRHWVERHDLALFDVPTQLAAYREVDLKVRHLRSRFTTTRGLYVAVKPLAPTSAARVAERVSSRSRSRVSRGPSFGPSRP